MSSDVAVSYTVVFEEVGDGWIQARLHELPAVITACLLYTLTLPTTPYV